MTKTHYIWDDDAVIAETDDQGAVTASYTREPDDFGSLISQTRGGQTHFYHYDALGSTAELSDSTETITDTITHSAFGGEIQRNGTTQTPYTWVGQLGYQNDHANSTSIRRRSYSPRQGFWLSRDPVYDDGAILIPDDVSVHPYLYANASPLNTVDPSGLLPTTVDIPFDWQIRLQPTPSLLTDNKVSWEFHWDALIPLAKIPRGATEYWQLNVQRDFVTAARRDSSGNCYCFREHAPTKYIVDSFPRRNWFPSGVPGVEMPIADTQLFKANAAHLVCWYHSENEVFMTFNPPRQRLGLIRGESVWPGHPRFPIVSRMRNAWLGNNNGSGFAYFYDFMNPENCECKGCGPPLANCGASIFDGADGISERLSTPWESFP